MRTMRITEEDDLEYGMLTDYCDFHKPKMPTHLTYELPYMSYSTEPQGSRGRNLWGNTHGVFDYTTPDRPSGVFDYNATDRLEMEDLYCLGMQEAYRMFPRDNGTVRQYQWALSVFKGRHCIIQHVYGQVNWSHGSGLYYLGYKYAY